MKDTFILEFLVLSLVLHQAEFSTNMENGEEIMRLLEIEEPKMKKNLRSVEVTTVTMHKLLNKYICYQVKDNEHIIDPNCENCYKEIFSLEGMKNETEFMNIWWNCTEEYPPHYFIYIAGKASDYLEESELIKKCNNEYMQLEKRKEELYGTIDFYIILLTLLFSFNWFMSFDYSPQHIIFMEEAQTTLKRVLPCLGNIVAGSENYVDIPPQDESTEEKMINAIKDLRNYETSPDYYVRSLCLDGTVRLNSGCQHCYRNSFPAYRTGTDTVTTEMMATVNTCMKNYPPYVLTYAKMHMRKYLTSCLDNRSARFCEAKVLNTTTKHVHDAFPNDEFNTFIYLTSLLEIEYVTDWFSEHNDKDETEKFLLEVMCEQNL